MEEEKVAKDHIPHRTAGEYILPLKGAEPVAEEKPLPKKKEKVKHGE